MTRVKGHFSDFTHDLYCHLVTQTRNCILSNLRDFRDEQPTYRLMNRLRICVMLEMLISIITNVYIDVYIE